MFITGFSKGGGSSQGADSEGARQGGQPPALETQKYPFLAALAAGRGQIPRTRARVAV